MIVARLLALALSHVPDQGAVDAITEAARAAQMTECARLCVDVTGEGDAALAFLADGLNADRAAVYAAIVRAST